jgi:hypothetical protein
MILNNSYNDKEINRRINALVGEPFSLWQRIRRKGIGSRRQLILEASVSIQKEVEVNSGIAYCLIEMRPKGLLVHFRKRLEAMVWVVPYYQLTLFQNGSDFSIHAAGEFVRIGALANQAPDFALVRKIQAAKSVVEASQGVRIDEI